MTQLAPEVAVNKRNYFEMTTNGDVWSLGIFIFRLLTGEKRPIKPATMGGRANVAMLHGQEAFLKADAMPDTQAWAIALGLDEIPDKAMANSLVEIFQPNPNKRPTAAEALATLKAMVGPTALDEAEQRTYLIELSEWPASNANT